MMCDEFCFLVSYCTLARLACEQRHCTSAVEDERSAPGGNSAISPASIPAGETALGRRTRCCHSACQSAPLTRQAAVVPASHPCSDN